jgi:NhaP-type Na+/H+ or K+/H+ antiporter
MQVLRQLFGFSTACFVGLMLPVAATTYDAIYRHHGSADSSWFDKLLLNIPLIALGSACVGLPVGVLGVVLLRGMKRSRLRDYAIAGLVMGAISGAVFTAGTRIQEDPGMVWLIFTTLPALSMGLGFACYWTICVRNHAS